MANIMGSLARIQVGLETVEEESTRYKNELKLKFEHVVRNWNEIVAKEVKSKLANQYRKYRSRKGSRSDNI